MSQTTRAIAPTIQKNKIPVGAAEAFYSIFRALPRKERLAIAGYILADEDVQTNLDPFASQMPNETTKQAFNEPKEQMAIFETIDDLRKDLLS
ncbi:MAG: hypothetical protein ACPGWR_22055 [Ardenticatenaceae bacterium]